MIQTIKRARFALAAKNTNYHLKYPNGGKDPSTTYPGMQGDEKNFLWCDCAGFVAWCNGFPRRIDGFPDTPSVSGGWINTDSMIEEATGFSLNGTVYPGGKFFRLLEVPVEGCTVVYHSRDRALKWWPLNPQIGHTGIVSYVPEIFGDDIFNKISVIHCSAGNNKRFGTGRAIAETSGVPWKNKKAVFIEFIG